MSDSSRDLLVRGIAAAAAGDKKEAAYYLDWVLRSDATHREKIEAWLWLAEISDDPAQQRDYLENVLAYDMSNAAARRKLAILDGKLHLDDIVDVSRLEAPDAGEPKPVRVQRFVCSQCGARMIYDPRKSGLFCQYCGGHEAVAPGPDESVDEHDFLVTLATARGHRRPQMAQAVSCASCGASYVLSPETLSLTCAYCGSVQVVKEHSPRELIPPEAIIPFTLARSEAKRALIHWLKEHDLPPAALNEGPVGLYLPIWIFNVGGQIGWRITERTDDGTTMSRTGTQPVLHADVRVLASRKLPGPLAPIVDTYDTGALAPYDPRYLADWPAETYEISVSDASLTARQIALGRTRGQLDTDDSVLGPKRVSLNLLSSGLIVESYQLVLVPLWMAIGSHENRTFPVAVNGQTGSVRGKAPGRGLKRGLNRLLGKE